MGVPTKSFCSPGAPESGAGGPARNLDSDLSSLSCRPGDGLCKSGAVSTLSQELVHNLITNYSLAYYLEHCIRTVRMAL